MAARTRPADDPVAVIGSGSTLNDVKAFGALGDGVTDDRVAIQAAIDDARASDRAGVFFPAGTYRVSRASGPGERWSLDLVDVSDFTVAGEGPASVVKLVDTSERTSDWHVFILRGQARRVLFTDLVIDGNRAGLTEPDEQSHGIEVEAGTEDLVISRCIARDCFGDGVRLLGTPEANVRRVRIDGCLFHANKRSGLGVQRALEEILVVGCQFEATVSDQSIDFEPSGADAPSEIVIDGCTVRHTNRGPAVTLTGIRGPDPVVRVKFSNNVVIGGELFCVDVSQLTVQNNTIVVPGGQMKNRIPVQVQRGGDSVVISGNLLINQSVETKAVVSLSEVNQRQVSRAVVSGNLCRTVAGSGVQVISSDDVAVDNNMLVAEGPCTRGVLVRAEASDVDRVAVRANDITVSGTGRWLTGIQVSAPDPHRVGDVSIVANTVHGAETGVSFSGAGFLRSPVCGLNQLGPEVTTPLDGMSALADDALVVGGALSRGGAAPATGGARRLAGIGAPTDRLAGNVGDVFQRLDGGAGPKLFVKESGNGTTDGWVPK
jgi:Pectate lyase superfamily protein/Right handed beta helix region